MEREDVLLSRSYDNLLRYIRETAVRFSCTLDHEDISYDSGTAEDIKYRIGKVLFKPAVNLEKLSREERFYSLCSAYVVLKDAYTHGTSDDKYAVESAYYYSMACSAVAVNMEWQDAEQIQNDALDAFLVFEERGRDEPSNRTYNMYREEAKKAILMMNRGWEILEIE